MLNKLIKLKRSLFIYEDQRLLLVDDLNDNENQKLKLIFETPHVNVIFSFF